MKSIFRALQNKILLLLLLCSIQGYTQIEEGYFTIHQAAATAFEGYWDKEVDKASLKGLSSASATQVFKIEKDGAIYYIKQAGDGRAIDASYWHRNNNGCPVIFWELNKGETQRWIIERISGDNYIIKLALNNKIITANVPGTTGSPDLYLTNVVDNAKQIFTIKKSARIIKSLNFVDLRANQTPYANQGPRGTCTYFASIAALEAGYKKAGYGDINLSEQFYSIFAKNFCLHPIWAENRSSNFRENQYALTQGGGTVEALKAMSVVKESISPYETTEDLGSYLWSDLNQRNCSSFNLDLIKTKLPSLADVSQYYGVQSFSRISTINEANLESVLRAGYEIKICIYRGSHCVLLVGFDKTDPLNKKLIIKNSYQPTGTACTERLEYLPYSEIPAMVSAEYVTAVKSPHSWREMAAIGRWKLNFDGWKGTLDIYHIPGVSQFDLNKYGAANGSIITDRRLGTFYDVSGNAFRVNGSITPYNASSVKIIFYIDGATPNLRWDALSGRRFEYIISLPDPDFMAGIHRDSDGSEFGGYAIKDPESYFSPNSFSPTGNITAFRNLSFLIRYKSVDYFGTFNTYNATLGTLRGTFTNASGATKTFQLKNLDNTRSYTFSVDGDAVSGKVVTHSWDPGVASGFVTGSTLSNSHPVSIIRKIYNPFLPVIALPGTIFSGLREGETNEEQNSEIEISESNNLITIDDMLERNKEVTIYNMTGGHVFATEYGDAGKKTITTELPDGMYVVVVNSGNLIKTKKVVLHKN